MPVNGPSATGSDGGARTAPGTTWPGLARFRRLRTRHTLRTVPYGTLYIKEYSARWYGTLRYLKYNLVLNPGGTVPYGTLYIL